MRGMIWFLGVLVILLGVENMGSHAWQWLAVWASAAAVWLLVGCAVILFRVTRAALDKSRAGALETIRKGLASAPAPKKEGQV